MAPDAITRRVGDSIRSARRPLMQSARLPREIVFTEVAIVFTSVLALWWLSKVSLIALRRIQSGNIGLGVEDGILIPALAFFFFGQLVYLFCRLGFLRRTQDHHPASRAALESIYDNKRPPPLTVLVPSYCERIEVVWKTLLSAALLEY